MAINSNVGARLPPAVVKMIEDDVNDDYYRSSSEWVRMACAEIFNNEDGTKTGFYSGERTARREDYNLIVTIGDKYRIGTYFIVVTNVRKNAIITSYVYPDGQVASHSFTPRAFFLDVVRYAGKVSNIEKVA